MPIETIFPWLIFVLFAASFTSLMLSTKVIPHQHVTGSLFVTTDANQIPSNHRVYLVEDEFLLPHFDQLATVVKGNEDRFLKTTLLATNSQVRVLVFAYYMQYHCIGIDRTMKRFQYDRSNVKDRQNVTEDQLVQLRHWYKNMVCLSHR